ncbi:MAG TPA: GTP cyclohydrolase I, partial [Bryobacteraceae bacterium]|nr:GTP cyclohydrolase I [Bryobacteraceae bacterium]
MSAADQKNSILKTETIVKVITPKEEGLIASRVRDLLRELGENPEREGLLKTPDRVEKALRYLTSGYKKDLKQIINGALFSVKY